jgi:hypothetical protein
MSRFMVTGGFVGFFIVFLAGLMDQRSTLIVLRDGMLGCLVMALLFRLFYSRLESGIANAIEQEAHEMMEQARLEAEQGKADAESKNIQP